MSCDIFIITTVAVTIVKILSYLFSAVYYSADIRCKNIRQVKLQTTIKQKTSTKPLV